MAKAKKKAAVRPKKTKPEGVVRAVILPVGVPLGNDPDGKPWTWEAFNELLNRTFRMTTELANWAVHQLYTLDTPGVVKTPEPVAKWYGYGEANEKFDGVSKWAGAMASMNCVLRGVHRKYVQTRFECLVRAGQKVVAYRYPFPFPVHKVDVWLRHDDGGFPVASVPFPGVGRVEMRLKRRADFGRQLAAFRYLVEHPERRCEAAVYRDRKGNVMVKVAGRFDPRPVGEATNACFLHTDPAALLVCEINGRSVSVTNGDHVRRWVKANERQAENFARKAAEPSAAPAPIPPHRGGGPITSDEARAFKVHHTAYLERARQDKKREVRMDRRHRKNLNKSVDDRCGKFNRRMNTAVKQVAAQVVRMCQRQGVGLIAYDDADRSFVPDGFPWHALKERLRQLFVTEMGGEWIDGQFTHLKAEGEKDAWLAKEKATAAAGRKAVAHTQRKGPHPAVTPNRSTPKKSSSPSRTTRNNSGSVRP